MAADTASNTTSNTTDTDPYIVAPHEQPGLTKTQADGLKAVSSTLLTNQGGLASDAVLTSLMTTNSAESQSTSPNPDLSDMGPASTTQSITVTRSKTFPNIALSLPPPIIPTPLAQTGSPTLCIDAQTPPLIPTFEHVGLKAYLMLVDNKKETTAPMAMHSAGNIQILAEAVLSIENGVGQILHDLKNLAIEVHLRDDAGTAPAASLCPSALKDFPPPLSTPMAHGDDNDDDDVVEHLEEPKSRTNQLHKRTDDTIARLTVMQNLHPPQNVVAEQLSPSLHAGLKVRFDAITWDRDVLNSSTEHYAARQEKVNIRQSLAIDTLHTENAELDARARSQSAETRDLKHQHYNDPDQALLITMGPFLPMSVLPTELFETHLHTAIPDHFRGAKPYHVEHDPVISCNLRVSLQTMSQVKALMSAWAVNNVPGYYPDIKADVGDLKEHLFEVSEAHLAHLLSLVRIKQVLHFLAQPGVQMFVHSGFRATMADLVSAHLLPLTP
ncbi:hypothetical protein C8J57DRAFT_1537677 [Mycena rebaudengoi]|nr:hypothetical protein C8J57DRAFT_1537677 [Mycena rebaudengoi]